VTQRRLAFPAQRAIVPSMASANRCPKCRETIHPFAATCPSCGTDLDAHRRSATRRRWPQIGFPRLDGNATDLVVVTLVMLLLAVFAPLFGALFALFIVWHAQRNGLVARRTVAIVCAALAIFNLAVPGALLPHLL
jgi:hypothetical protein